MNASPALPFARTAPRRRAFSCRMRDRRSPAAAGGAQAPAEGADRRDRADRRARGRSGHRGLRRADAELAGGQHPGARLGLARQARLHRRRGRQGRPGAVPDGPEAVPGAGRRGAGGAAAQPGGAAGGDSRTSTAPSRSPQQNALSQKDLDDAQGQYEQAAAAVAAGEGAARDGAAQPVLHDDPLAGRRRVAATRRSPTAPTSTRRTRSSRRCRC